METYVSHCSFTANIARIYLRVIIITYRPEGMKLRKLQQLREEQGELSSSDDTLYRQLRNTCEKELLQVDRH